MATGIRRSQEGSLYDPRYGVWTHRKGLRERICWDRDSLPSPQKARLLECCQESPVGPRAWQWEMHTVRRPRGPGPPNQILELWPASQSPPGWHSRGPRTKWAAYKKSHRSAQVPASTSVLGFLRLALHPFVPRFLHLSNGDMKT